MKETPQQYTKRILSTLGGKNPVAVQSATAARLARLVRGLSRKQLSRRPAPGKWSITEILAHLAEVEMVVAWRLRQALTSSGTPVQAFDQDAWARAGRYQRRDPRASLELFRAARACNLTLLRSLRRAEWKRYHMHQERGKETIFRTAQMIAGHDINHLRQVEGLRRQARAGKARG
jgi:hypothetical protein